MIFVYRSGYVWDSAGSVCGPVVFRFNSGTV